MTSLMPLGPFRAAIVRERRDAALRDGVVVSNFDGRRLSMPFDQDKGRTGVAASIGYAARYSWAVGRLAGARLAAELSHVRPFYSAAHNVAVLALLAVLYPLVLAGLLRHLRQPLAQLMAVVGGTDLLIVADRFADLEGRFLLHTFPLLGVFAGCEATRRFARLEAGR